jgi:hypothetical protein
MRYAVESTGRFGMELGYHVTLVKDATAAKAGNRSPVELGRGSSACGKSNQQFGRGQDGMREHRRVGRSREHACVAELQFP